MKAPDTSFKRYAPLEWRNILLFSILMAYKVTSGSSWIDSLDNYARERISPPQTFDASWQNAPLLHAMELQYDMMPAGERQKYLDYVKIAMDRNLLILSGLLPNTTAPANGVAFLYRVTGDPVYLEVAKRVYRQYKNILKTSNGGVSHLFYSRELWDDTVYMIGVYLLSMYRATGDETYILELIDQIKKHQEKLAVNEWGLWVHGWDDDNKYDLDFCSQSDWADPVTRRSSEIWGRGNGWVVVTLSEILNNLPQNHPQWEYAANTLKEMILRLPELQDAQTGHWYQLPVRNNDPGNYIESSCTAMFGYGILTALKYGIVSGEPYKSAMDKAYYGLRDFSTSLTGNSDKPYLTTKNVALETCLGDKDYYFNIPTGGGKPYASAVYIIFGRAYEKIYLNGEPTGTNASRNDLFTVQVSPTIASPSSPLQIRISAPAQASVRFVLIDILGRMIRQGTQQLHAGENTYRFDLDDVQRGQYFMITKTEAGEVIKSAPVIIQ